MKNPERITKASRRHHRRRPAGRSLFRRGGKSRQHGGALQAHRTRLYHGHNIGMMPEALLLKYKQTNQTKFTFPMRTIEIPYQNDIFPRSGKPGAGISQSRLQPLPLTHRLHAWKTRNRNTAGYRTHSPGEAGCEAGGRL